MDAAWVLSYVHGCHATTCYMTAATEHLARYAPFAANGMGFNCGVFSGLHLSWVRAPRSHHAQRAEAGRVEARLTSSSSLKMLTRSCKCMTCDVQLGVSLVAGCY